MCATSYGERVTFHDGDGLIAPGLPCTVSAATPTACKWCASKPDAGRWAGVRCQPLLRNMQRKTHFRSSTTSAT